MWKVREIADKVTNVVMNYTDVEAKVREATNDDSWGPTGQQMQDVAQHTFTYEHFPEVMTMLWRRMLQDNRRNWRRTYKSLLLLNYLVKNGSERVVTSAREHIYDLRGLENYSYFDENGKDQGINVRHKVKELIDFVQDDDRLREERKKAKKNKDKYIGMSSDSMGMRFGGGGGWEDSSSSWGGMGTGGGGGGRRDQSEYSDWGGGGGGNNKNSDRFSDEGEHNDSDSDVPSPRQREKSSKNEYKDSESLDSPEKMSHSGNGFKSPLPSKNAPTTKQPTSTRNIKKVDLGAAATFAKEAKKTSPVKTSSDLFASVDDDFNPRASEPAETSDFGEFHTAVETTTSPKSEDDFADFHTAFSDQTSSLPAFMPSANTASTGAASNADLLMGLGSQPPVSAPVSLMGGPNLFGANAFSGPTRPAPMGGGLDDLFGSNNPLDSGNIPSAVLRMRNSKDLSSDLHLLEANGCLEGPETPQKFSGLDATPPSQSQLWQDVLQTRLRSRDPSPELLAFCQLAPVDELLRQALDLLAARNQLIKVIEPCLRSQLADFVLKQCRFWHDDEQELEWAATVQIIVSLPARIGNVLRKELPAFCKPESFSAILFYQFGLVVDFLSNAEKCAVPWKVHKLALFLSKLLVNYGGTESAETFFQVAVSASQKDQNISSVFAKLLNALEGKSCENFVTLWLLHGPMDKIIGKEISPEVKNQLLVVQPFLRSHPKCNLPLNLVDTVAAVLKEEFADFVTKVASVWANKSAISHTSVEQQTYLSEMLVWAAKHMGQLEEKKVPIQREVMNGVTKRLQDTSPEKKFMCMVVAEHVLAVCLPSAQPLKFEYDPENELTKHLNNLKVTVETAEGEWLEVLRDLLEEGKSEFIPLVNKLESTRLSDISNESEKPSIILDSDDEDDEFEAFDMSADTAKGESRPVFLRELLHKVQDDAEVSLDGVADMIRAQLPDDDPSLACELLDTLLNLDLNKCADGVVAVIEVHPEEAVQHLAGQLGVRNKYASQYLSCVLKSVGSAAANLFRGPTSSAVAWEPAPLPKNSRRIHSSRPPVLETKSKFAQVAPHFLYPLLPVLHADHLLSELQVHLLATLTVITACSVNCPRARKMSLALLEELVLAHWPFTHSDAEVRVAGLKCLLMALTNLDVQGVFECMHRKEISRRLQAIAMDDPEPECRKWASKGLEILL
ncbi:telomere length regulation protein TEL2 homolog isoform X1 [Cloeon dipterum]|uniref:telomere length regulation protein TEL2 homolog isoform X1 n=1 Tax=Cloeon dipterum TaxID=197152 RepID=UPI0032206DBD